MANAPAALSPAPAMSGGPILKMTGVSKRFPGVLALENVHLEVGPSEIHALLGENGAGKSTLLKILSGAQSADAGEIELFGEAGRFCDAPRRPARRHRHDLPGVHPRPRHDDRRERVHWPRTRLEAVRELAAHG